MTYFLGPSGELVRTGDPDLDEILAARGYAPLGDRRALRPGEQVVDWPGTKADLQAVVKIRQAARALPAGVLCVKTGHVGTVEALEELSDVKLLAAVEYARYQAGVD